MGTAVRLLRLLLGKFGITLGAVFHKGRYNVIFYGRVWTFAIGLWRNK